MDFLLGLLGILQIILIPGLIVYRFFSIRANLLDKALIVFGTSLVANYCVVFLLSLLGIYTRITLSILILAEFVAIVWLYRKELVTPAKNILEAAQDGIYEVTRLFFPQREKGNSSVLYYFVVLFLLLLSVGCIFWAVNILVDNLGTVFSTWDAVVSWNRWATIWAAGQLPMDSHFYPQLIPANWSITYVLLGSTAIQFFAKAIMPFFTLVILLGFFNLVLLTKKYYFLISIVLLQPLLTKFLNNGLYNGYVDIAVAFYTFATLYILLKARETPELEQRRQLYLLGALFSVGAAVTKQSGVYIALCYPVLVYADMFFSKAAVEKKQLGKWIAIFAALSLIWISWYVLKEAQILSGTDRANIDTLINLSANTYDSLSLPQQIAAAIGQHRELILLFILILLVFPWMDRFYQMLTLLFAPYPLLWAWMGSYDTRNLAVFLPVLALVAGYALDKLILQLVHLSERTRWMQMPAAVPVVFACIALFSLNFFVSPQELAQRQVDLQRQIFSPAKNQMLLDLVAENGPQTRILTNYPMEFIPGLEEYQVRFDFEDYDQFLVRIQDPAIEYLLVPNAIDDRVKDFINARVDAGDYQVIFKDKQWKVFTLIKMLNRH